MALILTGLLFLIREFLDRVFVTLLMLLWLITFAFVLLAFLASRFHTLTLEENSIIYHSGIISTRNVILPYAKITEASYTQGLVQRVFGVGTLKIDTAGGSDVAIYLNDVKYDDLKKILGEVNTRGDKGDGT